MSSCQLDTGILSGCYQNRCPDNTGTLVRMLQDACTKLARIINCYKAQQGQDTYETNRSYCGRNYDFNQKSEFIGYVAKHFFDDNWSLDACYGRASLDGEFTRDAMVCVKTLYN